MIEVLGLTDWQTQHELLRDIFVAGATDDSVIVEVGVFVGSNVAWMAQLLKKKGIKPRLYAIDKWECVEISEASRAHVGVHDNFYDAFIANLERCGVLDMVIPIKMDAMDAPNFFKDEEVDFANLDDDHNYPHVLHEIQAWLPKVKKGGILSMHDYCSSPGIQRAAREVFGNVNLTSNQASFWAHVT